MRARPAKSGKKLKVTQIASAAGRYADQRQTLIGLGLNKIRRSREKSRIRLPYAA